MNKEYKDEVVVCKDCGKEFIFTINDQKFYEEMGFNNKPVRCKDCRNKRKNSGNNDRRN